MPSRRSRSRSRSRSPERQDDLPGGAEPISDSDYFLKSAEFRVWLKDEKGKYFDQLSGEKSRSYFRKFVKAWNRGKLPRVLYAGVEPTAQSTTAYKWSFASKTSKADRDALSAARAEIESINYGRRSDGPGPSSGRVIGPTGPPRAIGPALPSSSDLTLAHETAAERDASLRKGERKRARAEALEQVEEAFGPKPVGREGALEKKRARREDDKSFRESKDDGFVEADEKTLLGGGDSFRERIAQRDAARKRFEEKRNAGRVDRSSEIQERTSAIKEKDKATMDMFMKMAAERFG